MNTPNAANLAEWLHEQTAAFAAAAEKGTLDTWIPTCPEWHLRDLVEHVARAHLWAVDMLSSESREMLPQREVTVPDDPGERTAWLVGGAERLVETVERIGPDTPVWTFVGLRPPTFWLRRMLHDTTVHHADAALAVGADYRLHPELAADAVTEGLELMTAVQTAGYNPKIAELRGEGETILFLPEEADVPGWLVTLGPDGFSWERRRNGGRVTVRGPVTALLLVFSRRAGAGDPGVSVAGERALLDFWSSRTAFG